MSVTWAATGDDARGRPATRVSAYVAIGRTETRSRTYGWKVEREPSVEDAIALAVRSPDAPGNADRIVRYERALARLGDVS